jgi:hypothetical protein
MSNIDKFTGGGLPAVIEQRKTTQTDADFEFARENIMDVINKGQEALFDLIDVARQSQHPRAYEVLSTMMNTMVGASKDLLDLQAKKKKLLEQQPDANAQQITNNLFVGSTADLQKMVENIKNNKHE